jgi:hypothetical protein
VGRETGRHDFAQPPIFGALENENCELCWPCYESGELVPEESQRHRDIPSCNVTSICRSSATTLPLIVPATHRIETCSPDACPSSPSIPLTFLSPMVALPSQDSRGAKPNA